MGWEGGKRRRDGEENGGGELTSCVETGGVLVGEAVEEALAVGCETAAAGGVEAAGWVGNKSSSAGGEILCCGADGFKGGEAACAYGC